MKECGPLQPYLHKCRLHSGQYAAHLSFVDVAHQAPALGAFDDHLLHHTVLDYSHTGLGRGHIDQYLFSHPIFSL